MLSRACQQNTRNIYVPKTSRGAGGKANKKTKTKKTSKRQWASSRKEQSIQQHPDFRRNIVRFDKPLSSLDLNDWVKELGIKKFRVF